MGHTIRVHPEAYTKLVELMGLMQVKKRRLVKLPEVIDEILNAIPKEWYDEWFKF